jgi:hypothetical protein
MTVTAPHLSRRIVTAALPLAPRPPLGAAVMPAAIRDVLSPQLDAGHRVYAVIDGCHFPGLSDLLAPSGRAHCGLVQGAAADGLGDAAPMLIELGLHDPLLRWLWSAEGVPLALWGRNAGVLILSPLKLEGVRAHLRRLVMLRNEAGKWLYFRFFAPSTLHGLMQHLQQDATASAALFGNAISALIHEVPGRDQLAVLRPHPATDAAARPPTLIADARLRAALDRAVPRAQIVARLRAIEAQMAADHPPLRAAFAAMPRWWRFAMARDLWRTGVTDPAQGMGLAAISIDMGMLVLRSPAFGYVSRNPFLSGSARARHMIESYRMVSQIKEL